jgi:hypothetical protein
MRVIIYRGAADEISVGLESDEGTHGQHLHTFPLTMRGELSAFIAAQDAALRLQAPVFEVCCDGHLMLVQRRKILDPDHVGRYIDG